jgi:hypothetical protein
MNTSDLILRVRGALDELAEVTPLTNADHPRIRPTEFETPASPVRYSSGASVGNEEVLDTQNRRRRPPWLDGKALGLVAAVIIVIAVALSIGIAHCADDCDRADKCVHSPTRKLSAGVPERPDLGFKCWRWLSRGKPRPSDPVYEYQHFIVLDKRVSGRGRARCARKSSRPGDQDPYWLSGWTQPRYNHTTPSDVESWADCFRHCGGYGQSAFGRDIVHLLSIPFHHSSEPDRLSTG